MVRRDRETRSTEFVSTGGLTEKARGGVLAILAAALLFSPGRGAEEQCLRYVSPADAAGADLPSVELALLEAAPEGLELPIDIPSDALFARWQTPMAKAGYVGLALTKSKSSGGYDTIYVDSDADGSLANEPPSATRPGRGGFGPVRIAFGPDKGPTQYHAKFALTTYKDWHGIVRNRLDVTSACRYEGTVRVGGKTYQCALFDYNSNGAFNDSSMDLWQCDRIRLGGADVEPRVVGKYMQVDGKLYLLGIAKSGAWVSFEEVGAVPTGTVRTVPGIVSLTVAGENGHVDLEVKNGRAAIPAGKWIPYGWRLKRKDAQGVDWSLSGWRFPESAVFEITEGKETELGIDASVIAGVSVLKVDGGYSLQETLTGALGERITVLRAGEAPPPANIRVRNADSSYNETFQCQFG